MVKLSKEKMIISLVIITLIALVVGNVASLATDLTNTDNENTNRSSAVIQPRAVNNTNAVGAITSDNNTTNNTSGGNTVGAITSNTNTNSSRNTSSYNTTGKLPYAGSNSTVIFVVIALAASALYAYKKVSDYNV